MYRPIAVTLLDDILARGEFDQIAGIGKGRSDRLVAANNLLAEQRVDR